MDGEEHVGEGSPQTADCVRAGGLPHPARLRLPALRPGPAGLHGDAAGERRSGLHNRRRQEPAQAHVRDGVQPHGLRPAGGHGGAAFPDEALPDGAEEDHLCRGRHAGLLCARVRRRGADRPGCDGIRQVSHFIQRMWNQRGRLSLCCSKFCVGFHMIFFCRLFVREFSGEISLHVFGEVSRTHKAEQALYVSL